MNRISIEELSVETFLPFGFFARLIGPEGESLGGSPVTFFRDMLQLNTGGNALPSFSVCKVESRPLEISTYEFHSMTGEGILPLDNDVAIHVVPATRSANHLPLDKVRVFRLPRGTMVVLRPGVWHHAPFTLNDRPAHVLIVLPERTYANDCTVKKVEAGSEIFIDLK
jgi:ureidoglycolate lyase